MPRKSKADQEIDLFMENLPAHISVNELYNQFIGMTNVERVHEEDFVLRSVLRNKSKNWIIETLKKKYPDTKFNYDDIERFLSKNRDVVKAMGKEVGMSARRHLEARAQCSEMLASVALYTSKLVQDFRSEGDNTNTVGAIRALNSTLETYMKLEGMTSNENEGGKVVNIIQTMSDGKSRLKDKIHNANFTDVDDEKDSD